MSDVKIVAVAGGSASGKSSIVGLKKAKENGIEAYWIDPEGNEFKTDGWETIEDN